MKNFALTKRPNRHATRICQTDNIFIGRQILGRENAPARKANPSFSRRYLDPKYSRWLSADPAVSDYMDKTKEGVGGIYNANNMNLYHYSNNNPIKYIDPDGEKSGYLNDSTAVGGFGHSAMFVETYNEDGSSAGFDLYEVGYVHQDGKGNWTGDTGGKALSHENLDFSMGASVGSSSGASAGSASGNPTAGAEIGALAGAAVEDSADKFAGVSVRHYDSYDNMKGASENQRYDNVLNFDTNRGQDAKIKAVAEKSGEGFGKYNVLTNNCTQHAAKALAAGGIKTTQYPSPNAETSYIRQANPNAKEGWE